MHTSNPRRNVMRSGLRQDGICGSFDSNGKEIFVGDIVQDRSGSVSGMITHLEDDACIVKLVENQGMANRSLASATNEVTFVCRSSLCGLMNSSFLQGLDKDAIRLLRIAVQIRDVTNDLREVDDIPGKFDVDPLIAALDEIALKIWGSSSHWLFEFPSGPAASARLGGAK